MLFRGLIVVGLLAFLHIVVSSFIDAGTNSILFCAHLFFLFCGHLYAKKYKSFSWSLYFCGYFILFFTLLALSARPLLFILALLIYTSFFHRPKLLGYLFIFLFSIVIFTGYWVASFIIFGLFYLVVLQCIKRRGNTFFSLMLGLGFLLMIIIFLPLFNLLFQATPQDLMAVMNSALRTALGTSVITALISTLIISILGVPLGYCMARMEFKAKPLIDALIDLPILIPQSAVGIALLVFLGPKTPLGEFFMRTFHVRLAGSYFGIIACQVFVSMPFLVRSAINAFERVNLKFEHVSQSLGANHTRTFFKVSLPLALSGIFNGAVLSFSRALSEAGSLMIVAYRPSTIPIYINDVFTQYGTVETIPVTVVFVGICLWSFIVLKWIYEIRKKSILAV